MKHIIIIFCLVFLFACKNKDRQVITMNNTRPINELKDLVLTKGDTSAYEELSIAYLNNNKLRAEYLLYSLLMANKYNYSRANFYVYFSLKIAFEGDSQIMDDRTRSLALDYLKRGVNLRDPQAIQKMGELYMDGKFLQKDSLLGKKMIDESNEMYRKINKSKQ